MAIVFLREPLLWLMAGHSGLGPYCALEPKGPKGRGDLFMKTRNWQSALAATLVALTFGSLRAADEINPTPADGPPSAPEKVLPKAPVTETAPAVNNTPDAAPGNTFQLPKPSLPPLLDQVVRLNQSGTDESIVRAYIEKAAPPYQITGNEILQLQERGVPKNVILSLIEHSKTVTSATPVA